VGTVKPDVSVCLDQVDGLGLFLEIEVLSEDDESADETLAETIELVGKTFGDSLPRVTKGYDRLLIEAQ
jgi:adenylate cyclase class 2